MLINHIPFLGGKGDNQRLLVLDCISDTLDFEFCRHHALLTLTGGLLLPFLQCKIQTIPTDRMPARSPQDTFAIGTWSVRPHLYLPPALLHLATLDRLPSEAATARNPAAFPASGHLNQ